MDIVSSRVFWGAIIILIGLAIVLNGIFKINIPLFRIIISFIFIYIGIVMLIGVFPFKKHVYKDGEESHFFSENVTQLQGGTFSEKYNTIFGKQVLDLSKIELRENEYLEVNAIFASQMLILPPDANVEMKVSSVFGSAKLPNGQNISFGDTRYHQSTKSEGAPTLYIDANVVFGSMQIHKKSS